MHQTIAPIAGAGFVLSLVSNLAFWAGIDLFGPYWPWLFGGIFVIWIPTVIGLQRSGLKFDHRFEWSRAFRGAPSWVLPVFNVVFVYAFVNFFLGFLKIVDISGPNGFWRVGSSHAMVFYGAAFGLSAAAVARAEEEPGRDESGGTERDDLNA